MVSFANNKESYVLSNRFVTEFLESYEKHNLAAYNAGDYAYKQSEQLLDQEIVSRANNQTSVATKLKGGIGLAKKETLDSV